MTSQKLNFSVEGEFLTQHWRSLVLEGRANKAYQDIINVLVGPGSETGNISQVAIDLLSGNKKLVGTNDLYLEDDDDVEYKAELDWMYSDLYYDAYRSRYYSPYLAVVSYSSSDEFYDRCPYKERAEFYANDSDLIFANNYPVDTDKTKRVWVLYKEVPTPPFWIGSTVLPENSYEAHMKRGKVKPGGYQSFEKDNEYSVETPDIISDGFNKADYFIQRHQETINNIRIKVRAKTEKWYNYDFGGTLGEVSIPYEPLVNWALSDIKEKPKDTPKWTPVSPSNIKMQNDNKYHSDWILGAEIPLEFYIEDIEDFQKKQYILQSIIQSEIFKFKTFSILKEGLDSAGFTGIIRVPKKTDVVSPFEIAVIPNGSPSWYECVKNAQAIVVNEGGKLMHLVQVLDQPIIRLPEATTTLKEDSVVAFAYNPNRIEIMLST